MKRNLLYFIYAVLTFSLISCSTFFEKGDRNPSSVSGFLPEDLDKSVPGEIINARVHLTGDSGFFKKLEMINTAKPGTTVSMAYFIFEDDYTSSFLADAMIQKANAGVKFRLIVDYFMSEKYLSWLKYIRQASNSNIEIKRFRPPTDDFKKYLNDDLKMKNSDDFIKGLMFQNSDLLLSAMMSSETIAPLMGASNQLIGELKKIKVSDAKSATELNGLKFTALQFIMTHPDSLKTIKKLERMPGFLKTFLRRMHHKITIAYTKKGKEFIVGGRNISDEYHISADELKHEENLLKGRSYPFYDCELSGMFNAVDEALDFEKTFDKLWISTLAVDLDSKKISEEEISKIKETMHAKLQTFSKNIDRLKNRATGGVLNIESKVLSQYVENSYLSKHDGKEITLAWQYLIENARENIQIVSAYLYLYPELVESFKMAVSNGVQIDIYTNSMDTTDLSIVNVGAYSKMEGWTKDILANAKGEGTIRFHELGLEKGTGSLHAKIINIDDTFVGIGSANSDPRSHLFDTNNLMIMNFKTPSNIAKQIFSFYVEKLPWEEITPEKLKAILGYLLKDEKSKIVLKLTSIPYVQDQL